MKSNTVTRKHPFYPQAGFTLIELLIVVVILGVLAAVVIPQFADSTDQAREAAVKSNLGALRSAIELYRADHGDYPGLNATSGGAACTGGTIGAAAAGTEAAYIEQLSLYTDANGGSCDVSLAAYPFGPYIKKNVPNNPFTATNVTAMENNAVLGSLAAAGVEAWRYSYATGELIANDSAAHALY